MVERRFKEIKVDIGTGVRTMRSEQSITMGLNGVQVGLFGLTPCRNDAPELRIILEALPVPKTEFKNKQHNTKTY